MTRSALQDSLSSDVASVANGNWPCVALSELVDQRRGISYGIVQPGSETPGGIPILRVNDIRDGHIQPQNFMRVSEEIEAKHQRTRLRGGEVVLTVVGAYFGQCAIVPKKYADWNVARAVAVIPLRDDVDPRWIVCCLRSDAVQQLMQVWATTTAQPTLNLRDVALLSIPMPSADIRETIADVFFSLDDKIELNRRMNETLEATAQALFQSWFIDFDPVRAKTNGQTPHGCDSTTAALFPDQFQDSDLGQIPKGWDVRTAAEIATVGIGKTPPRKEHQWFSENPSDVPWISIRDLGNAEVFIAQTSEFLTREAVEKFRIRRIPCNTVVLSFKLTMGRVAITDVEMLSNEAIAHFLLNPETPFGASYLYCYLKSFGYDQLGSTSSIATAINSDMVRGIRILIPRNGVASAFETMVSPLFEKINKIQKQSRLLVALRDALLRKLLSSGLSASGVSGANP